MPKHRQRRRTGREASPARGGRSARCRPNSKPTT
nr:MAG TPA: hypothetical protein [Caudoviricetes sp.]